MKKEILVGTMMVMLGMTTVSAQNTSKTLEQRVTELEDREAIRRVIDEFNTTADVKDMKTQGDLFTEDAVLNQHFGDQVNVIKGREAIRKAFGDYLATVELTYHLSGQMLVDMIDETHATCESYGFVTQIFTRDGKRTLMQGGGRYVDEMLKIDGKWYINVRHQYAGFGDSHELPAAPQQ